MSERIRTIKPEWRTDQKLAQAGLAGRVLSVALITLADDQGRGVWRDPVMAVEVFGYEPDPSRLLRDAVATLSGWYVEVYSVRGERYFQILNWAIHQRVDKAKPSRIPPLTERDDGGPTAPEPTPGKPWKLTTPENVATESRQPPDAVATDSGPVATASGVGRETLAPGPGTLDHGPGIGDPRVCAREPGGLRTSAGNASDGGPAEPRASVRSLPLNPTEVHARYVERFREALGPKVALAGRARTDAWAAHWELIAAAAKRQADLEGRAAWDVLEQAFDGFFADAWLRDRHFPPTALEKQFSALYAAGAPATGTTDQGAEPFQMPGESTMGELMWALIEDAADREAARLGRELTAEELDAIKGPITAERTAVQLGFALHDEVDGLKAWLAKADRVRSERESRRQARIGGGAA